MLSNHNTARPERSGNKRLQVHIGHCAQTGAANDNDDIIAGQALLSATLRHFAVHGLGAAAQARHLAETALAANDRAAYHWWLGVCHTLDRRMAQDLVRCQREAR